MDVLSQYFKGNELAAQVWKSKYAGPGEETPNDMHTRMAAQLAPIMYQFDPKYDFNYVFELLRDFRYIVPQGSIMATLGVEGKVASLSNCFVIPSPEDSYGGIMLADEYLVQLMKRRGGVGVDISSLRPRGVPVKNAAGTSTGAASFMERFSSSTREVAQDGRRGALMLTISVRHPDAVEFINMKQDRTKVTGANVSVQLSDDFMRAVREGQDYIQVWPVTAELSEDAAALARALDYNVLGRIGDLYVKRVNAKQVYDQIIHNAWDNAEPGQMFMDRMHAYSPDGLYPEYKTLTTNPCGEIGMGAYDACRLVAINLFSYVNNPFTPGASFDYDKFRSHCYDMQVMGDAIVTLELEHIDRIINAIDSSKEPAAIKARERQLWENVKRVAGSGRRTGCGFTALGDALAALNIKYDSADALQTTKNIMREKFSGELTASIELAKAFGPFTNFDRDVERDFGNEFFDMVQDEFPLLWQDMMHYGRRNVSWSTVAPTGTVSLMTQTSSGLEPMFMPFYTRRRKINPSDVNARIDFVDQNGDKWMEYPVLEPKFQMWMQLQGIADPSALTKDEAQEWFEKSPWYGSCAGDIDWTRRVEMQAVIQQYTTHSISSTINLPNSVTKDEVAEIYIQSWLKGLKGVTVYRDGCRTGVLVAETKKEEFAQHSAPKRPKVLPADVHHVVSMGQKVTIVVGLLENKPYEVFISPNFIGTKGTAEVVKDGKGAYKMVQGDKSFQLMQDMPSEILVVTRLVSTSLRHGAEIKFVVQQLRKSTGSLVDISGALARVLSKYVNGEVVTEACSECGASELVREEGCLKCKKCGYSKCG